MDHKRSHQRGLRRRTRDAQSQGRNQGGIFGIDYTPTILEALELGGGLNTDGRSYLPLLLGKEQEGRDTVFTQFNTTHAKDSFPMHMQSRHFGYIFNAWAAGETDSKVGTFF